MKLTAFLLYTVVIILGAFGLMIHFDGARVNNLLMRNMDTVEMPINFDWMTERLALEGVSFLEQRQKDEQPFLLYMGWLQVHTHMHASPRFKGKLHKGKFSKISLRAVYFMHIYTC